MTKIQIEELANYFQEIYKELSSGSAQLRFSSYVFPEELTAEHIANKFGVTRAAAMNRLRQLEKDNILISKRANVTGKPGKRIVFFPKEFAIEQYDSRPKERMEYSYARYGARDLLHENYERKYEIMEDGDAILTVNIAVRNISNKKIEEIALPKLKFDTYESPDTYDRILRLELNGKVMPYSSNTLTLYRQSIKKYIKESIVSSKHSQFYSEVVYVVPLDEALNPGETVHIKLVTHTPRCFQNMRNLELAGIEVIEFTLRISIQIIAPKGFIIRNVKRYEDKKFRKGMIIYDNMTGIRKEDLEECMPKPKTSRRTIRWSTKKPPIGCQYYIPFMIAKLTASSDSE
ncbi:MAG: hypothetical protein KAS23_05490 [Anaerohalosphaera sp.]|nr:hypothetical protein [Anaerohalosphaera sp.]